MKSILFISTILFSLSSYSQTLETIRIKKKIEDKDGYKYKVEYYVLKSDTSIKHGAYRRYNIIKDLEETGYFKNGIKDSTWRTYSGGKMVNSIGNYLDGKKEGEWNYYTNIPRSWNQQSLKSGNYTQDSIVGIWKYYKDGKIEQEYDHTNDSLVFANFDTQHLKYEVKMDAATTVVSLERPPLLIGGNCKRIENWKNMDQSRLYSLSKGTNNVNYAVSFWVNKDGSLSDFKMEKGVNDDFDAYILEYYKNNYDWVPGVYKGETVSCRVVMSNGYIVKM